MATQAPVSDAALAAVTHSTFIIERTYPASPQRVFAALSEPEKKRRWFVESNGRTVESFEMDFRVGGRERNSFVIVGGPENRPMTIINDTTYLDIQPDRRVVLAYSLTTGGRPFSASLATFELRPRGNTTELLFTEQGAYMEGADGPERRKEGWQKLLSSMTACLADAEA